jgi:hypothetical protein
MGSLQTSAIETVDGASDANDGKNSPSSRGRSGGNQNVRGRGRGRGGRGGSSSSSAASNVLDGAAGRTSLGKKFAAASSETRDGGRTAESDEKLARVVLTALYGISAGQMLERLDYSSFVTELEKELHRRLLHCNVTTKKESWSVGNPCRFVVPLVVDVSLNEKVFFSAIENYVRRNVPSNVRTSAPGVIDSFLIFVSKTLLEQTSDQSVLIFEDKCFHSSRMELSNRIKKEALRRVSNGLKESACTTKKDFTENLPDSDLSKVTGTFSKESRFLTNRYAKVVPPSFFAVSEKKIIEKGKASEEKEIIESLIRNVKAHSALKNAEGQEYLGYTTYGEGGMGFGFYDMTAGRYNERRLHYGGDDKKSNRDYDDEDDDDDDERVENRGETRIRNSDHLSGFDTSQVKLVFLGASQTFAKKPKHVNFGVKLKNVLRPYSECVEKTLQGKLFDIADFASDAKEIENNKSNPLYAVPIAYEPDAIVLSRPSMVGKSSSNRLSGDSRRISIISSSGFEPSRKSRSRGQGKIDVCDEACLKTTVTGMRSVRSYESLPEFTESRADRKGDAEEGTLHFRVLNIDREDEENGFLTCYPMYAPMDALVDELFKSRIYLEPAKRSTARDPNDSIAKSQNQIELERLTKTACSELFRRFNMAFENDLAYHATSVRSEDTIADGKTAMNVGTIKYGGTDFCIQFGLDAQSAVEPVYGGSTDSHGDLSPSADSDTTTTTTTTTTTGVQQNAIKDSKHIRNGETKRIFAVDNGVCEKLTEDLKKNFYSRLKLLDFSEAEIELCYSFNDAWDLHQDLKSAFVSFVAELGSSYGTTECFNEAEEEEYQQKIKPVGSIPERETFKKVPNVETLQDILLLFVKEKVFKMLRLEPLVMTISVDAIAYVPLNLVAEVMEYETAFSKLERQ